MADQFQKKLVNDFLKKFGLKMNSIEECSPLVREWAQRMQNKAYLVSMQNTVIEQVNQTLTDIDRQLAEQVQQSGGAQAREVEFLQNQQRLLNLARKNLMTDNDTLREVHEMLMAGIQSSHESLKKESGKPPRPPQFTQPVLRMWATGTDPVETALLAKLKFLQKSRTMPDGKKEYFIIMHPNAIITWAARKEIVKTLPAEEAAKNIKELSAYFMHAGGEEYYHVYQHAHEPTRARLDKDSKRHYGSENYEQVRLRMQKELADLERTDREEFHRRSAAYHQQDPIERNAANFMAAQDAKHVAMAEAYYQSRQKDGRS